MNWTRNTIHPTYLHDEYTETGGFLLTEDGSQYYTWYFKEDGSVASSMVTYPYYDDGEGRWENLYINRSWK